MIISFQGAKQTDCVEQAVQWLDELGEFENGQRRTLADEPEPTGTPGAASLDPNVGATTDALELDPTGMPHDTRIHTGTKSKNQDGTWRYTRKVGLTAEMRAEIETELRAKGKAQLAAQGATQGTLDIPATTTTPAPGPAVVAPPGAAGAAAVPASTLPPIGAPAVGVVPPVGDQGMLGAIVNITERILHLAELVPDVNESKVHAESLSTQIRNVASVHGLMDLKDLPKHEALWPVLLPEYQTLLARCEAHYASMMPAGG